MRHEDTAFEVCLAQDIGEGRGVVDVETVVIQYSYISYFCKRIELKVATHEWIKRLRDARNHTRGFDSRAYGRTNIR